ncbi:MAG: molybdenum cofactor synthesis domain-containing protein [Halobacteriaceae archaeon]
MGPGTPPTHMQVIDAAATRDFDPESFAKSGLFETDRMFADVYCFEPGQAQEVHAHDDGDKVYYVLDGHLTAVVGDEERTLAPGEAVVAEAGEAHGLRNDGDERARALVVMAWGDTEGQSGHSHDHAHHHHDDAELDFAVLTITSSRDEATDESGRIARRAIEDDGHDVVGYETVADDEDAIRTVVSEHVAEGADAVVTTGGTGLTPDDVTVEAVRPLLEKELPGVGEHFRRLSHERVGTAAMLSRATGGVVDGSAVFCLPGSPDAAELGVEEVVLPEVGHVASLAGRN